MTWGFRGITPKLSALSYIDSTTHVAHTEIGCSDQGSKYWGEKAHSVGLPHWGEKVA